MLRFISGAKSKLNFQCLHLPNGQVLKHFYFLYVCFYVIKLIKFLTLSTWDALCIRRGRGWILNNGGKGVNIYFHAQPKNHTHTAHTKCFWAPPPQITELSNFRKELDIFSYISLFFSFFYHLFPSQSVFFSFLNFRFESKRGGGHMPLFPPNLQFIINKTNNLNYAICIDHSPPFLPWWYWVSLMYYTFNWVLPLYYIILYIILINGWGGGGSN